MPQDLVGPISRLLDEMRPAEELEVDADDTTYHLILDYGDRLERLRYDETELPGEVREALDLHLESG